MLHPHHKQQKSNMTASMHGNNYDSAAQLVPFGQPFQIQLQPKDTEHPIDCDVMFLNNGFEVCINGKRFALKNLFVESSPYTPETVQSMLSIADPDGLSHIEYQEGTGLIFHAGEECRVCIADEDAKTMFCDLITSPDTENPDEETTCTGLQYEFLKMPPMLSWMLRKKGNCGIVLRQLPEIIQPVDRQIAQSLQ